MRPLATEFDMIVTVNENTTWLTLDDVKEKLIRHYEKLQQQESAEGAFKAGQRGRRQGGSVIMRTRRTKNRQHRA
ncbi:TPA: hypothetical protein N0F65_001309 [Lagenidium giganteum]|uniref:Uncharacterized protein n=1 Tax=Lagenidium giganteum TaxID=4803 RepID=A0AAV2YXT2_9STRA|nr:TPA: hypothetical protein N0F65_001309 [Lagenidium giganteum]